MKDLENKRISIVIRGFPKVLTGTLIKSGGDCILVRMKVPESQEGKEAVVRIPKGSVGFFYPLDEGGVSEQAGAKTVEHPEQQRPLDFVPCNILCCLNPTMDCRGVKYIKAGKKPIKDDFHVFMKDCPKVDDSCKTIVIGELRDAPGKVVAALLDGTMYGDYPKK